MIDIWSTRIGVETPRVTNVTNGRLDFELVSSTYVHIYISFSCIIAILGIIANVFMFYVIVRVRSLHKPTNFFLLSLTTSDLLVCSIVIPLYIQRHRYSSQVNGIFCLVHKFLFLLASSASLWSLAVVSLDRMVAVTFPLFHKCNTHTRQVIRIIVAEWLLCLASSSTIFYPSNEWKEILSGCSFGIPREIYLYVTIPLFYLPAAVIFLSYVKIFLVSRQYHQNMATHKATKGCNMSSTSDSIRSTDTISSNASESTPQPRPFLTVIDAEERRGSMQLQVLKKMVSHGAKTVRSKTHRVGNEISVGLKAAKTVSVMVGVCILFWGPTAGYNAYLNVHGGTVHDIFEAADYLQDIFLLLSFTNSLVNPILYTLLTKDLKRNSKKLIKKLFKIRANDSTDNR